MVGKILSNHQQFVNVIKIIPHQQYAPYGSLHNIISVQSVV